MIPFLRTLNCFTSRRSRPRRSGRPTRYASTACVQALESRQLLTGTVSLAITAAGDVSITGDSKANLVEIEIRDGDVFVTGTQGTSLNFGRGRITASGLVPADQEVSLADAFAASLPGGALPNPLSFRNLSINMGTGDDTVIISASEDVNLSGSISADLGTGQNTLIVATGAGLSVAGNVTVSGGKGHDLVALVTTLDGQISVGGNLNVTTSRGTDVVVLGNVDPGIALLDSDDVPAAFLALVGENGDANSILVNGSLTVSTGDDNDLIGVSDVAVNRDARLDNGFGNDIMLANNFDVGGNLTLHYGDLHVLQDVNVLGTARVTSGTGNDIVAVNQVSVGALDVDLGSGNDVVAVLGGVNVARTATVKGGSGRDTFAGVVPAGLTARSFELSATTDGAGSDQLIENAVDAIFGLQRLEQLQGIVEDIQTRLQPPVEEDPNSEAGPDTDSFGSPNVSPLNIGEITPGADPITFNGFLNPAGTIPDVRDGIQFTLTEETSISLDLLIQSLAEGEEVFGTPQISIHAVTRQIQAGDNRFVIISPTAAASGQTSASATLAAGTYVIAINGENITNTAGVSYSLTLSTDGGNVDPPEPGSITEENDSFGSFASFTPFDLGDATQGVDVTFSGSITSDTDESDLIGFTVTEPVTVQITVIDPSEDIVNEFGLVRRDVPDLLVDPITGSFSFNIVTPGDYGVFIQHAQQPSGGAYSFRLLVTPTT